MIYPDSSATASDMHVRAFSYISRGKSTDVSLLSFASLRRAHNAIRSQVKEKPAKFANGSLLGNDSRIFVQHHDAYPLSRMRLLLFSLLALRLPPRRFPSAHFSFSKFYRPETPVYFIPSLSTLPFLGSLVLPLLP